jgi:alkanesulfonate monooxygenase SsuD/methylene tetrahydromethanopterin reductase-like flavin-dependent oxidoreductase (luciferase family)
VTKLGVIFTADRPPEELPSATALAATKRITVGLGVMPAVFRNPVIGTPDQVFAALRRIAAANVDSIAVAPIGPNHDEQLQLLAHRVVPAFQS